MIELGITLPNYRANACAADILETAERAERLGFHSVWVADHVAIGESYVPNMGATLYETHTTLSVVAGRTSRVKLGCSVMPTPYRHPLLQAKSYATLDHLSNGRVIYGGATGYMVEEFHALGIDFDKRAAITDEYLQVMKLAWTADVVDFHGEFVDCARMICAPKPLQQPHPPIWLGGDSTGAFHRIARLADGWHGLLGGSPGARHEAPTLDNFAARIDRLKQIAESEKRDPATIALSVKANARIGADESRPLYGSVAKIVDDIKRLEELGLELVVMAPNLQPERTSLDVVDEIASEIMPRLR